MEKLQSFPDIGTGDTFPSFQFKLKDPDNEGSYLDLTNYVFCSQLKTSPGGRVYHEFPYSISVDTVTFEKWTIDVPGRMYLLDIKVTDENGDIVHTSKFYVPIKETISSC